MFNRKSSFLLFALLFARWASANVDIAVVLHDGVQYYTGFFWLINTTLRHDFPKQFPMGENKTRVALVANTNVSWPHRITGVWHDFTGLTGDVSKFQNALDTLAPQLGDTDTNLFGALKMIRERVFAGPATRHRAIFLISYAQATAGVSDETQNEGKLLREAGVFIYVIYEADKANFSAEFMQLAGYPRFFQHPAMWAGGAGGGPTLLRGFKDRLVEWLCGKFYNQSCFYNPDAHGKCEMGWYRTSVPPSFGNCSAVGPSPRPSPPLPCEESECEKVCDDLWPWTGVSPNCSTNGSRKIDIIGRRGKPPWNELSLCHRKIRYECPPPPAPIADSHSSSSSVAIGLGLGIPMVILIGAVAVLGGFLFMQRRKAGSATETRKGTSKQTAVLVDDLKTRVPSVITESEEQTPKLAKKATPKKKAKADDGDLLKKKSPGEVPQAKKAKIAAKAKRKGR